MVLGQQAGLGMLNSQSDRGRNKWVTFGAGLPFRLLDWKKTHGMAYDAWIKGRALAELRKEPMVHKDADFDVLVLYLPGLDEDVHNGRVKKPGTQEVSDEPSEQYVREYLDGVIKDVVEEATAKLGNSAIYALAVDHGHTRVEPTKQMDLGQLGVQVRLGATGRVSWHDVLTPKTADPYRVSKKTTLAGTSQPANVVFAPAGEMAHVYVASDPAGGALAWTRPPLLERLTPLVSSIREMTASWTPLAITDILVRVPGPNGEFAPNQYRVVPRGKDYIAPTCDQKGCQPTAFTCGPSENEPCTLEAQLLELSKMEQAPFRSDDPLFDYADPARRIAEWASENTGDIVILANVKEGFYFDKGVLASNHGSLTYADAVTPLAFAYPGATSDDLALDNVLNGVRAFLKASSPEEEPARAPIERRAMEAALGLLPCDLKETGKCEEPTQPPEP